MLKYIVSGILCCMLLANNFAFAQDANSTQESRCYESLKESMQKFPQFSNFYEATLKNKSYQDVVSSLSNYYENMSSFGITLDEPRFEMRVASFGKQTSYVHPPYSPFPDSKNSDTWIEPAKEFIFSEEYVRGDTGEKIFLGCAFMQIVSDDLMEVKGENYLYDGSITSIIDTMDTYKAWYTENESYDYENNPFVTWKRLFVFPKDTQNKYFSKYDVIDSFPNVSLDEYNKQEQEFYSEYEKLADESGEEIVGGPIQAKVVDADGQVVSCNSCTGVITADALQGNDQTFVGYSLYQAIENTYPDFAQHLSMRGVVSFVQFKKILSGQEPNEDMKYFWDGLVDNRDLTIYAQQKEQGNNTEAVNENFDVILENMDNLSEIIEQKVSNPPEVDTVTVEVETNDFAEANESKTNDKNKIILLLLGFALLLTIFMILMKKLGKK